MCNNGNCLEIGRMGQTVERGARNGYMPVTVNYDVHQAGNIHYGTMPRKGMAMPNEGAAMDVRAAQMDARTMQMEAREARNGRRNGCGCNFRW